MLTSFDDYGVDAPRASGDASAGTGAPLFGVTGTVAGLDGYQATLFLNGTSLQVKDGPFSFPAILLDGVAYEVTVSSPQARVCAVERGRGKIAAADARGVIVTCRAPVVSRPPQDASIEEDASFVSVCPNTTPINLASLPWTTPRKLLGACSKAELDALVTYIDANPGGTYAMWKGTVTNPACASCMFGAEADATWAPMLEDAAGALKRLNVGGCIAIASANESCGKSYQNWFDCRFAACNGCPAGDTSSLQKCLAAASKGPCKPAFDAVGTVCGDQAIGDAETACSGDKFVFEGPVRLQCIGPDGGE